MYTITVSNYKSRTGKSTTAFNLALVYAVEGYRVLLIDLDPQASVTEFFGLYEQASRTFRSTIALLYGDAEVEDVAMKTTVDNLSVIPSVIELLREEQYFWRENRLKYALEDADADYDICIIDCNPSLRNLAYSAYLATSPNGLVIVPAKCDKNVLRGTILTINDILSLNESFRAEIPDIRILKTFARDSWQNIMADKMLDDCFGDKQFETVIHRFENDDPECLHPPLTLEDFRQNAIFDYVYLAREIENEFGCNSDLAELSPLNIPDTTTACSDK
ncbi:MAG: ParA family protein [Eggerthellaceae bacterium]|nr:ParA family protein [Eggerthellaceae bacterium]